MVWVLRGDQQGADVTSLFSAGLPFMRQRPLRRKTTVSLRASSSTLHTYTYTH